MIRWLAFIIFAGRQSLTGLVVLATLSAGFGFQAHADHPHTRLVDVTATVTSTHDGDSHVASTCTHELTNVIDGDGAGGHNHDRDSGSCGHCHCHIPVAMLPTIFPTAYSAGNITTLDSPIVLPICDGMTYQPDPPPIRS